MDTISAESSGSFALGGEFVVNRLGYGTMQLTGPGVWGPFPDPDRGVRVLRRAVELGVTLFDTADSYGPETAEELLREALHPYPENLVIATKAGFTRPGPGEWRMNGRPDHLRRQAESSLRRLGLERIPLFQLHRVDPSVPFEDQIGTLKELRDEGKIAQVGLSEVGVEELERARAIVPVASVQNLYNLAQRDSEAVLEYAEANGIAFLPWFPLATGQLARPGGPLARVAARLGASPSQVALAWLLHRSPVVLPIPGTSSVEHLEENVAAAALKLTQADYEALGNPFARG
ncbi:aldo/keto reductase [Streptomyces olivaceoviridis]|uniref:aldo/keto reductase n=1 Tax=Streptomyces olivaceoviridis TaxID=1921 RepID=UPI00024BCEDB|nr:putative oxidoreductase [Streptomyces hygroscopicus subsp. jinggangensis 5008]AGF60353.1 putative oxidoreductase [Streptomyces hygroscopicus subsp. jinggangensis TL01]